MNQLYDARLLLPRQRSPDNWHQIPTMLDGKLKCLVPGITASTECFIQSWACLEPRGFRDIRVTARIGTFSKWLALVVTSNLAKPSRERFSNPTCEHSNMFCVFKHSSFCWVNPKIQTRFVNSNILSCL